MSNNNIFSNLKLSTMQYNHTENMKILGENNAIAHSMYGMGGKTNTNLQGSLVAAFNGILRNTSINKINKLFKNVYENAQIVKGNFEINAIVDLFVMWAQCRDRNNGKGERLVSYYMFLNL